MRLVKLGLAAVIGIGLLAALASFGGASAEAHASDELLRFLRAGGAMASAIGWVLGAVALLILLVWLLGRAGARRVSVASADPSIGPSPRIVQPQVSRQHESMRIHPGAQYVLGLLLGAAIAGVSTWVVWGSVEWAVIMAALLIFAGHSSFNKPDRTFDNILGLALVAIGGVAMMAVLIALGMALDPTNPLSTIAIWAASIGVAGLVQMLLCTAGSGPLEIRGELTVPSKHRGLALALIVLSMIGVALAVIAFANSMPIRQ